MAEIGLLKEEVVNAEVIKEQIEAKFSQREKDLTMSLQVFNYTFNDILKLEF